MGGVKCNISCHINKQRCHIYLWSQTPQMWIFGHEMCLVLCHLLHKESQAFTGGWVWLSPWGRPLCTFIVKKKKKKGLKSQKQIQCKFKSNSSRLQIHFFPITLSFTESFCNKKSRIWASLGPETMCGISAGKPWVWAEFKPEHMDWSPNLRWMISVVTTSLSCGKE